MAGKVSSGCLVGGWSAKSLGAATSGQEQRLTVPKELIVRSIMRICLSLLLPMASWLVVSCRASVDPEHSSEATGSGFAIYLPEGDLPLDESTELSRLELSGKPILSIADVISYAAETHAIELTPSAAERLSQLKLPGKLFIVTVDRQPVYHGAFIAAYMSRSYDGVVILWPSMDGDGRTIRIQLGYPGPDFFAGEDPRSDPRIMESINQAGKLK